MLSLLLSWAVLAHPPAIQEPPKAREQKSLALEFLSLDHRTVKGWKRQEEILLRLQGIPLPKTSQVNKWRRAVQREIRKGRKIAFKKNRQYWGPEEKRGLFMVGGETLRPQGLLIGMHGGGLGSGDCQSSFNAMQSAAKELHWAAIFPEVLKKTEHGWTDSGTEEWVMELMDAALRTWKISPDRVYLAGHSMGGYGSWVLGAHHADRLAGVAPSAGAPTPVYDQSGKIIDVMEGVIPNLRNLALRVFQSTDDPQVPADANQAAVERIKKAKQQWGGYDLEYWQVDNHQHGLPPGGMLALMIKLKDIERSTQPEKVVWQPSLAWKRQFYWLLWKKPKLKSMVIAHWDKETQTFAIECQQGADDIQVLLNSTMTDFKTEITLMVNGRRLWKGIPVPDLATALFTAAKEDVGRFYSAVIPPRSPSAEVK